MRCLIGIQTAMHATFTLLRRPNKLELKTTTSKLQRKCSRMHRPTSSSDAQNQRFSGAFSLRFWPLTSCRATLRGVCLPLESGRLRRPNRVRYIRCHVYRRASLLTHTERLIVLPRIAVVNPSRLKLCLLSAQKFNLNSQLSSLEHIDIR
jgi:hypothetical protein